MDSIPSIVFEVDDAAEDEETSEGKKPSPTVLETIQSTVSDDICWSPETMATEKAVPFGIDTTWKRSNTLSTSVKADSPTFGSDVIRKRSTLRSSSLGDKAEPLVEDVDMEVDKAAVSPIKAATTSSTGETEEQDHNPSDDRSWHRGKSDQNSCDFSQSRKDVELADRKLMFSMQESFSEDDDSEYSAAGYTCNRIRLLHWVYIGSLSVIGASLRVYLSRLFGEDCEEGENAVQDIFTPFFSKICITAGGRTMQTGGALFRDWPANLLGCLFMGILTSDKHSSPFPWFPKEHPLQQNRFLHTGFGVGLCGCLTTFASWNSQMVVMMDGTYTVLDPQIAPALFGYILGMMGCVTSFRVGREASSWIYSRVNKSPNDSDLSSSSQRSAGASPNVLNTSTNLSLSPSHGRQRRPQDESCRWLRPSWALHFVALLLIALIVVGDQVYGNLFYKNMLITTLTAPLGALSRWKMSNWNDSKHPRIHQRYFPWLPWGTLFANLSGAILSIICQALLDRYSDSFLMGNEWTQALLFAIKVGYAGSLSTVSSLVKEVVSIDEKYPGHAKPFFYGVCTCAGGMAVGLVVYMMVVRI